MKKDREEVVVVERERIFKNLVDKWGKEPKCPFCDGGPWAVGDRVFRVSEFRDGTKDDPALAIPLVPVACRNCGATFFLNYSMIVELTREAGEEPAGGPVDGPH